MKSKMFAYLAVFTAIVLSVMWLFQIVLLDDIYILTVRSDAKKLCASVSVASNLDSESFRTKAYALAAEQSACISVFEVKGASAQEMIRAHSHNVCLIHSAMINEAFLQELYLSAKDERIYTKTAENNEGEPASILVSSVIEKGNKDLLIIVNIPLASVSAAVSTLHFQFIIITVILLIVSAIMAYLIAGRVTRPVVAMNNEAKKLALGNYSVNFEGGEFLETAQLGSTLNYAACELSKLDTMQKELISNISHDLRTPLTMISGYSEVMRDIPEERNSENMQIVIDETKRLSGLVNDLLDLSRLSGGGRKLNISAFSITECTSATIDRYSRLCERDGYRISFNADREIIVEADEMLILQVIYNLISNAINYTGEDKRIQVDQTVADGVCRISVSDTGDGIEEEKLPYIWDRYYRSGDYHKRAVSGTGLGLSIVKSALVLHGAHFGVSSTPGVGSTFWFELPVLSETELID